MNNLYEVLSRSAYQVGDYGKDFSHFPDELVRPKLADGDKQVDFGFCFVGVGQVTVQDQFVFEGNLPFIERILNGRDMSLLSEPSFMAVEKAFTGMLARPITLMLFAVGEQLSWWEVSSPVQAGFPREIAEKNTRGGMLCISTANVAHKNKLRSLLQAAQ